MKRLLVVSALAGLFGSLLLPACADDTAVSLLSLVAKRAPAIVTVRAVLKTATKSGGQGRDSESRIEVQGVLVDKSGLVMVSSMPWSPMRLMELMGQGGSSDDYSVKVTPTDIKVIFDGDEKEYTAFLAATDTKLDLTFLKVEDVTGLKIAPVEFTSTASAEIGQEIVSVSRLQKGFDYAPYFERARISGVINKPRKAWMLDGPISGYGLPIYAANGEVIGVLSTIPSGVQDQGGDSASFSFAMRMLSGSSIVRGFILPGSIVESVITQAKKRAEELAIERAKKKASGAADKPSATTAKPKKQPTPGNSK